MLFPYVYCRVALLYAVKQLVVTGQSSLRHACALLENLTDDAIAQLYVTKFLTISLYLTKLYVTSFQQRHQSNTTVKSAKNFSNSVVLNVISLTVYWGGMATIGHLARQGGLIHQVLCDQVHRTLQHVSVSLKYFKTVETK